MKALVKRLSSIKLTFWGLLCFIVCLTAGIGLTYDPEHGMAMKKMNGRLPLQWLVEEGTQDPVVAVWLMIVCLVASGVLINTACCVYTRFILFFSSGQAFRQGVFLLIHLVFGLVMLCHGLSMIVGYKYSEIELFPDQRFAFDRGMEIVVQGIRFVDDARILRLEYQLQRAFMTRENIHRHENFVEVGVLENGQEALQKRIFILKPLKYKSIQVTLSDFFLPGNDEDNRIGARLVITKNPITTLFFILYAVMIICLILFIAVSWGNQKGKQGHER